MALLLLLLNACDEHVDEHLEASPPHHEAGEAPDQAAHGEASHAAHGEGSHGEAAPGGPKQALKLSLNGTERWPLDEHTRTLAAEARASLASAAPSSPEEAQALQATLDEQLQRLIEGCTMEGPAHDELHVFLMAYMPAVEALGKAEDGEQAQARVAELRAMLEELDRSFE